MKVANPNPAFCSSCFQQRIGMLHIDFEVAWDGPVISLDGLRISCDDMIVCQECMIAAAGLLGFVHEDNPDLQGRLEETLKTVSNNDREIRYLKGENRKLTRSLNEFEARKDAMLLAEEALQTVRESVK
jgi:hypothetical protein